MAQSGEPAGADSSAARGGAGGEEDQNPAAPSTVQSLQSKLATTTEMLNINFNPNPEQKKTVQTFPSELAKQSVRVKKVSADDLPALIKALEAAGVEVKTP